MTMSWHMMVDFEPPLIACIVSEGDYSFAALRATRECVIAIPAVELAGKVVEIGNSSGRDIDKFAAFGLTKIKAKRVGAAAHRRVLRQSRMQGQGHDARRQIRPLHPRSGQSLAGPQAPKTQGPSTITATARSSYGETITLKSRMR